MSLLGLFEWLADTPGSTALRESLLMYPLIESIHVWTLALSVGLAAVLDLRLLGMTLRRQRLSDVEKRLFPWMAVAFGLMFVTGALLFYAIPVRTYQSIWFRAKLVLLCLAGLNVWFFYSGAYRTVSEWDLALKTPPRAKLAGAVSLILWMSIIVAGRFIAYNWLDCDRQPQPAIVNFLAGCVVP